MYVAFKPSLSTFLQEVAGAEDNSPLLEMHRDQTHNISPDRSLIEERNWLASQILIIPDRSLGL